MNNSQFSRGGIRKHLVYKKSNKMSSYALGIMKLTFSYFKSVYY